MLPTLLVFIGALVLLAVTPYALLMGICGVFTLINRDKNRVVSPQTRFKFIVPAHDEELTLSRTLESLKSVDYPEALFGVLVIADNCTDQTAEVARRCGVDVIERLDAERCSKGHALADVLPRVTHNPQFSEVDAVVIVDADTTVERSVLRELEATLAAGSDWVQGLNVVANPMDSWRTKLMAFGFALFNGSFQIGSEMLGIGAHLRGNGMCLTTRGLAKVPWTAGGLAEDLEFSWHLRLRGERISFARRAVFMAEMPSAAKPSMTQRQRWEKGRHSLWQVFKTRVLRARVGIRTKLLWILDLTMPSFTALVGIYLMAVILLLSAGTLQAAAIPSQVTFWAVVIGLILSIYSVSPFIMLGLSWRVMTAVLLLPYFVVWRGLIAMGRHPTKWVRTERRRP